MNKEEYYEAKEYLTSLLDLPQNKKYISNINDEIHKLNKYYEDSSKDKLLNTFFNFYFDISNLRIKKIRNKFFLTKIFYKKEIEELKDIKSSLTFKKERTEINLNGKIDIIVKEIEPNLTSIEDKYKKDLIKIIWSLSLVVLGFVLGIL